MAVVLGACSSAGQPETTVPADPAQSPEAVAAVVLDALAAGDAELAAANTIQDQMAWLAMAEGASLQEATGLLDDGELDGMLAALDRSLERAVITDDGETRAAAGGGLWW